MEKESKYSLEYFMKTKFGYPIGAMDINSYFLVIGTTMGKVKLYIFGTKEEKILLAYASEDISNISFDGKVRLNIAIGDFYINQFVFDLNNLNKLPVDKRYDNYRGDSDHEKNCENCYTMLSGSAVFQIQLDFLEAQNKNLDWTIENSIADYRYKNKIDLEMKKKNISIKNFFLPFDFDGIRFLYVEYLSTIKRNICVFNLINPEQENSNYRKTITNDFGHISYCKLLPNDTIFMVRCLTICEIRKLNDEFEIVHVFKHIGSEVIAVDIWYKEEENNLLITEPENYDKGNSNSNKKENLVLKMQDNKQNGKAFDRNVYNSYNSIDSNDLNKSSNAKFFKCINVSKKENSFVISLLDIYGNVNTWEDGQINNEFNLYKIKEICKEHKIKNFFSMGYCYYIKYNGHAFAISTDHGCYIIQKK